MSDCPFCKIAAGDIPAEIVDEGDDWLAFRDLNPQAPTHILIIPRRHIETLNDLDEGSDALMGKLLRVAAEVAEGEGIAESGYRAVVNCNAGGGQSVFHLHVHLLGGRNMTWPPG